jgi:hypothetical protein
MVIAGRTITAGRKTQYDVIADRKSGNTLAHCHNYASSLVSEHHRLRHRHQLIAHHHVGVANADSAHRHTDFADTRLFERHGLNHWRAMRRTLNSCKHLPRHRKSP